MEGTINWKVIRSNVMHLGSVSAMHCGSAKNILLASLYFTECDSARLIVGHFRLFLHDNYLDDQWQSKDNDGSVKCIHYVLLLRKPHTG